MKQIISSESVTEGHPDKICDKISDAVLDECLRQDPESRVACETVVKTGMVLLAGEITTKAKLDVQKIVRETVSEIGYNRGKFGFDSETCSVLNALSEQSPDISQGVSEGEGEYHEQGAGDQGLMYGFACNETSELMPLPIVLAHKLTKKLTEVRKNGLLPYLRPDGKSQVAVEYSNGKPVRIRNVIIASQHGNVDTDKLREDIKEHVIKPVCGSLVDADTEYFINATGKFEIGGPAADAGLTGRKIIVDTYGGVGRHGGGAFSGKDPSKVDRSAAYAARYIAKNIVAAGLADKCEVQLAYVIGVAQPTSIHIETFGTGKVDEEKLSAAIREHFPTKPKEIIEHFGLKHPENWCYKDSAAYGHFGRSEFPWEKTDKAETLQKLFLLGEVKEKVVEF